MKRTPTRKTGQTCTTPPDQARSKQLHEVRLYPRSGSEINNRYTVPGFPIHLEGWGRSVLVPEGYFET